MASATTRRSCSRRCRGGLALTNDSQLFFRTASATILPSHGRVAQPGESTALIMPGSWVRIPPLLLEGNGGGPPTLTAAFCFRPSQCLLTAALSLDSVDSTAPAYRASNWDPVTPPQGSRHDVPRPTPGCRPRVYHCFPRPSPKGGVVRDRCVHGVHECRQLPRRR